MASNLVGLFPLSHLTSPAVHLFFMGTYIYLIHMLKIYDNTQVRLSVVTIAVRRTLLPFYCRYYYCNILFNMHFIRLVMDRTIVITFLHYTLKCRIIFIVSDLIHGLISRSYYHLTGCILYSLILSCEIQGNNRYIKLQGIQKKKKIII